MYRFIWKIKLDGSVNEVDFLKFWKESSLVLQEYPGAMGTLAHKSISEQKTYFLVAQWASQEDRNLMQEDIDKGESERARRWSKFPKNETWGKIQTEFSGVQIDAALPKDSLIA